MKPQVVLEATRSGTSCGVRAPSTVASRGRRAVQPTLGSSRCLTFLVMATVRGNRPWDCPDRPGGPLGPCRRPRRRLARGGPRPKPSASRSPLCASPCGFTLHAPTRGGALDPEGREVFLRYVLHRPPVAAQPAGDQRASAALGVSAWARTPSPWGSRKPSGCRTRPGRAEPRE